MIAALVGCTERSVIGCTQSVDAYDDERRAELREVRRFDPCAAGD
jgi:hypothetical protein